MKEKSRNLVASVRQRLLNLSQERGEDPNLVFIRYALERFLYRLSRSRQSSKFILKGAGCCCLSWRPSRDQVSADSYLPMVSRDDTKSMVPSPQISGAKLLSSLK